MNNKDIFGLEYKVGNQYYILSKTEIRCIDQSKAQNSFSLPLNQIDPHYNYGGAFSPLWILFVGYLTLGIIARSVEWLSGSQQFNDLTMIQLIIFPFFLAFAGYQFYRHLKAIRMVRFCYLRDGDFAFSIPMNKKNKTKTQEFLEAISDRIHNAVPSNDYTLFLLRQYGLLTNIESTQLDANIQNSQSKTNSIENVIHFVN